MNNAWPFVFTAAVPTFVALVGILFNRQDFRELRQEILELRKDMAALEVRLSKEISDLRMEMKTEYVRKRAPKAEVQ
jgi:predicted patatin/cPLA2 family phospholipase